MQTTSDMEQPETGCCAESSFMKGVAENDTFRYEQSVQPQ
jgi:hypothetical protein